MAFVTINSSDIEIGDALKKELFDKIKANEDDLDTRLAAQEAGQKRIELIDCLFVNGVSAASMTGVIDVNAPQDLIITECYVQIYEKGSLGGELEIDVKVNSTPNDTGMTSIFTTLPKITYSGASSYDKSSNEVFNPSYTAVTGGHNLRLDVTELPTGGVIGKFRVVLYGEVS
jgi:hypothetical protein